MEQQPGSRCSPNPQDEEKMSKKNEDKNPEFRRLLDQAVLNDTIKDQIRERNEALEAYRTAQALEKDYRAELSRLKGEVERLKKQRNDVLSSGGTVNELSAEITAKETRISELTGWFSQFSMPGHSGVAELNRHRVLDQKLSADATRLVNGAVVPIGQKQVDELVVQLEDLLTAWDKACNGFTGQHNLSINPIHPLLFEQTLPGLSQRMAPASRRKDLGR